MADAPVDALLLRAEDLTKGWLLALLEDAPLDDAPAILAVDLARDGPSVCDAVVRALADDADLRRLAPGGALEMLVSRTGEFAGTGGLEATSRAVDALRGVIWAALREELAAPDPDQVSELAERLDLVVEYVRLAALRRAEGLAPRAVARAPRPSGRAFEPVPEQPRTERSAAETEHHAPQTDRLAATDRLAETDRPAETDQPATETDQAAETERGPAASESHGAESQVARSPRSSVASAPEALWVGAVEDEIARAERSDVPLSLLLAELEDADRIEAVEPRSGASTTFGRFAQALRSVVRRQDLLACETETRAWVVSRDTGRTGALALAARLAGAVRAAEPWRGAPMTVSIGVAVLGEDGHDSSSLIAAAEEARFAASAAGVDVAQADRGERDPDPPERPGPKLVG